MRNFFSGFEKRASTASHIAEIAGLGTLAVPSVQHLRGKPMSSKKTHAYEVGGLGILAAPSVYHLGKKILTKGKG